MLPGMRHVILYPLAAILFVVLALAGTPVLGEPSIAFEKTRHHIGTIWEGEEVSHRFRFRNEGEDELRARGG